MRLIDSHIHLDRMAGEDILRLSWGGVEVGIVPTPHLMSGLFYPKTLFELWEKTLDYMVGYAAGMGVDVYACLSVPFCGLTSEGYDEALKKLPEYLDHPRVVGIGEIGLDTGNDHELNLFKTQLALAKDRNLPVIVHTATPRQPQTPAVTTQTIDVLKAENFPFDKAIIDHSGKNTVPERLKSGFVCGLSICYDKLTAEEVSQIVQEFPEYRDKIIIGSELGYGGAGHLSLVKAAWAMKMDGMPVSEIERVTWENPKRLFDLPVS